MIKKLLPIFISVFIVTTNMLCVRASENILRGVDVKLGANSYTIELTSYAPAKMSKTIVSSNRVILNLKNIDISANLSSKFEGSTTFDNVIVEPDGQGDVNIMIQGNIIAFSDVKFVSPTGIQNAQDSIKSSFKSLGSVFSESSPKNRCIQFGLFIIVFAVILFEVRFIKSKYDELKKEKDMFMRNIEATRDFDDYLPGYGRAGIKKPYTTPIYGLRPSVNTNITKPKISPFKTPETTTLNSLLHNRNKEDVIINRIVNNTPVFGSLSKHEGIQTVAKPQTVSNPLEKSRLKSNLRYLEEMTSVYRNKAFLSQSQVNLQKRLNEIY